MWCFEIPCINKRTLSSKLNATLKPLYPLKISILKDWLLNWTWDFRNFRIEMLRRIELLSFEHVFEISKKEEVCRARSGLYGGCGNLFLRKKDLPQVIFNTWNQIISLRSPRARPVFNVPISTVETLNTKLESKEADDIWYIYTIYFPRDFSVNETFFRRKWITERTLIASMLNFQNIVSFSLQIRRMKPVWAPMNNCYHVL